MARIAHYTEEQYASRPATRLRAARATDGPPSAVRAASGSQVARSLARVASSVCEELSCKLIVAFTESGSTARLVSSYRPRAAIAAITFNDDTYRRLALWWGVVLVKSEFAPTTDEMIVKGDDLLKRRGLAASGQGGDAGGPEPHAGHKYRSFQGLVNSGNTAIVRGRGLLAALAAEALRLPSPAEPTVGFVRRATLLVGHGYTAARLGARS